MNTYRAMGATGYLFKNDSATEKSPGGDIRSESIIVMHKRKAGWAVPTGRFVHVRAAYWPLGTSELFWPVPVVAVPVPVVF